MSEELGRVEEVSDGLTMVKTGHEGTYEHSKLPYYSEPDHWSMKVRLLSHF